MASDMRKCISGSNKEDAENLWEMSPEIPEVSGKQKTHYRNTAFFKVRLLSLSVPQKVRVMIESPSRFPWLGLSP
ncbi:hypothetical protein HD598_001455 [Neomicrococcus aestuarii]|uniref:Uncharacterized protein n=1 Tax=Neomicrococcus aestuarii TaxID=556325 RepID=A0A7W8TTZ4_9MICC|nr:hypothetical protein [Neomicrococcus aestuarii]MBB5512768.1 hypothetical protein [Neomicrococcus aestuarii]